MTGQRRCGLLVPLALPFLLFVVTLLIGRNFFGPEGHLYLGYTRSLVEQGDLNLTPQLYSPKRELPVTPTLNYPDFHNHGGVVAWAPFYLLGEAAGSQGAIGPRGPHLAMVFSTAFFAFLTLAVCFHFCRSLFFCLCLFWGTPLFFYTFWEPGNANLVAALFSAFSLIYAYRYLDRCPRSWLFYGLYFSVCLAVKVDLWFQIVLVAALFFRAHAKGEARWLHGGLFAAGLLLGLGLKLTNDYLKYGALHCGEWGMFNPKGFYLTEQLFSPYRGMFYTSPIFLFAALGTWLSARRWSRDREFDDFFRIALSAYFVLKIILVAFRFAWGGNTFGGRLLLTELPALAFLSTPVLVRFGTRARVLAAAGVLWNLFVSAEYVTGLDYSHVAGAEGFAAHLRRVQEGLGGLVRYSVHHSHLPRLDGWAWVVLWASVACAIPAMGRSWRWWIERTGRRSFVQGFCGYAILAYLAVTALNLANNRRNGREMSASGNYPNLRVTPIEVLERAENLGSTRLMMGYFRARHDRAKLAELAKLEQFLSR